MWHLESYKPEPYKTVLLYFDDSEFGVTTGWWADKAGHWIGLALNVSPPMYQIEDGEVKFWKYIERPV